jgi:hypothetical protein
VHSLDLYIFENKQHEPVSPYNDTSFLPWHRKYFSAYYLEEVRASKCSSGSIVLWNSHAHFSVTHLVRCSCCVCKHSVFVIRDSEFEISDLTIVSISFSACRQIPGYLTSCVGKVFLQDSVICQVISKFPLLMEGKGIFLSARIFTWFVSFAK